MTDRQQLFLDRSPFIYVWRPFYRSVMTPVILPLLSAIRAYFTAPGEQRVHALQTQMAELQGEMAEINAKLDNISAQIPAVSAKIEATYLDSLGQWGAM